MSNHADESAVTATSDETTDESEDDRSATATGILRAITRQGKAFSRVLMRADIGSLPRRLPKQQLAKVTDQFSTALDVWSSYTEGKAHASADGSNSSSCSDHSDRAAKRRQSLKALAHGGGVFAKNAVLGTALFAVYENVFERIAELDSTPQDPGSAVGMPNNDETVTTGVSLWRASTTAVLSGATAGCLHGSLVLAIDSALARRFVPYVTGTLLSHSLVHTTLFGVYEFSKVGLMSLCGTDHSQYAGAAAVTAAGGIAGSAQEVVSHYTAPLEQTSIRTWLTSLTTPDTRNDNTVAATSECTVNTKTNGHATPNKHVNTATQAKMTAIRAQVGPIHWRNVLLAAPASAIGFLAFEYGRTIAESVVTPQQQHQQQQQQHDAIGGQTSEGVT